MKSKTIQEFKETEVGKIPVDWKLEKLGDVLTTALRHGIYKSKEFVHHNGVKILKMGILDSTNWIGEQDMERFLINDEEIKKFKIHEGNIIFARTSMMTGGLGNCGIVMKHEETIIFDGNLLCAELKTDLILPLFCLYYFKSKFGQNEISRMTGGTQSRSIPSSELSKVLVILPSKSEQIKISKTLFDIDSQIQNLQKQNDTLEQMAQAIFKSWFIDFDGVTEFEDSELGKIPKGWKIKVLEDICTMFYGKMLSPKEFTNKGYPVWNGYKIAGNYSEFIIETSEVVITCRGNQCGELKICPAKCWITNLCIVLKLNEKKISRNFLHYLLKNSNIKNLISGTAIPQIIISHLSNFKILIPTNHFTEKFEQISSKLFLKINENYDQIQILTETRDSLLPKLMSGEIRV